MFFTIENKKGGGVRQNIKYIPERNTRKEEKMKWGRSKM